MCFESVKPMIFLAFAFLRHNKSEVPNCPLKKIKKYLRARFLKNDYELSTEREDLILLAEKYFEIALNSAHYFFVFLKYLFGFDYSKGN